MKYPAYPEYTPTKIEWLSDIPIHWEIKRLKWSVQGCTNGIWGDEPDGVDDIVCIRVADFDRDKFTVSNDALTFRAVAPKQRDGRIVRKGDLLIEKSGGGEKQLVGCVVFFDHDFDAVCSNFIARMPMEEALPGRYWTYVHAALYSGRVTYPAIKQTTGIQNLDSAEYLNTLVAYPPNIEQQQIAAFLEWKTGQIDALIAKKKELIEKLKEKRLAVITQAVTKGLDPAAPLRDAGTRWLGQIPKSWAVKRLRFLVSAIDQGWSPKASNVSAQPDEFGVLKLSAVASGNFEPGENKFLEEIPENQVIQTPGKNEILLTRANTPELVGDACAVPSDFPNLIIPDLIYRLKVDRPLSDERFLTYFLLSKQGRAQIESQARGSSGSMVKLGQGHLKDFQIPSPSPREQTDIADYLDAEICQIREMVAKTQAAMEKLAEYRTALITAATTGKIDVREIHIPAQATTSSSPVSERTNRKLAHA